MIKNPLVISIIVSMMWGSWQTIAKMSKMPSSMISIMVAASTAIFVILWLLFHKEVTFTGITGKGVSLLILCGIVNGLGMALVGTLITSNSGFDISKYMTIITGLLPVVSVITAFILLRENISPMKIFGVIVIVIGVYIINQSK